MSSPVARCAEEHMKNTAAKSVTESPHLSAFAEQAGLLVCVCTCVRGTERELVCRSSLRAASRMCALGCDH